MAYVFSAAVTQAADGSPLTFTDNSTGIVSLVSRILNIYDSNGTLLTSINMGVTATATYAISADGYFSFVLITIDANGTHTGPKNYLSSTFFKITFVNVIAQLGANCNCGSEQLTYADIAQLYKTTADTYALLGLGTAAQTAITTANVLISGVTS